MKCPAYGGSYWMETACRLGNWSAQSFDESAVSWTMIKKFANDGTNGNGNSWVQYQVELNTGSNTQISVGFKLGSSGGAGPTVGWDSLVIDEPQYFGLGPAPAFEFLKWSSLERDRSLGLSGIEARWESTKAMKPREEGSVGG